MQDQHVVTGCSTAGCVTSGTVVFELQLAQPLAWWQYVGHLPSVTHLLKQLHQTAPPWQEPAKQLQGKGDTAFWSFLWKCSADATNPRIEHAGGCDVKHNTRVLGVVSKLVACVPAIWQRYSNSTVAVQ